MKNKKTRATAGRAAARRWARVIRMEAEKHSPTAPLTGVHAEVLRT